MRSATTATYSAPMRNMVNVIRATSPRSAAKRDLGDIAVSPGSSLRRRGARAPRRGRRRRQATPARTARSRRPATGGRPRGRGRAGRRATRRTAPRRQCRPPTAGRCRERSATRARPAGRRADPRRGSARSRRLLFLGLRLCFLGLRLGGAERRLLLTRGKRTFELRELQLDVGRRADPVELGLDVVAAAERLARVVERSARAELVDGAGTGLHLLGLVLGALHRQADVAHLLGDAGHRLTDLRLRLSRRVGRLDGLLARAERVDLRLQPLRGGGELLLLRLKLRMLGLQVGELLVDRTTTGQRLTGEVVTAGADRLLRLLLQLVRGRLELLHLDLEALAAGRDVRDATAHLGEQLELLLVAVVERLARVLRAVERLVGLGLEDQGQSPAHAHPLRPSS